MGQKKLNYDKSYGVMLMTMIKKGLLLKSPASDKGTLMRYKLPVFQIVGILTIFSLFALGSGCARAPSIDVFGSFFPGWVFCMAGGLLLTLVVRAILLRTGLVHSVGPLIIVYPSLMAIFAFIGWIIFFQN